MPFRHSSQSLSSLSHISMCSICALHYSSTGLTMGHTASLMESSRASYHISCSMVCHGPFAECLANASCRQNMARRKHGLSRQEASFPYGCSYYYSSSLFRASCLTQSLSGNILTVISLTIPTHQPITAPVIVVPSIPIVAHMKSLIISALQSQVDNAVTTRRSLLF